MSPGWRKGILPEVSVAGALRIKGSRRYCWTEDQERRQYLLYTNSLVSGSSLIFILSPEKPLKLYVAKG